MGSRSARMTLLYVLALIFSPSAADLELYNVRQLGLRQKGVFVAFAGHVQRRQVPCPL